jgi:hypothetical protein
MGLQKLATKQKAPGPFDCFRICASHELQHGLQLKKYPEPVDCFTIHFFRKLHHRLQVRFNDITLLSVDKELVTRSFFYEECVCLFQ